MLLSDLHFWHTGKVGHPLVDVIPCLAVQLPAKHLYASDVRELGFTDPHTPPRLFSTRVLPGGTLTRLVSYAH